MLSNFLSLFYQPVVDETTDDDEDETSEPAPTDDEKKRKEGESAQFVREHIYVYRNVTWLNALAQSPW